MHETAADEAPGSALLARAAVSAIFFLTGAGTANWAVRIPAVQERLALSEGALGVALLGVSVGALVAMPVAGRLVARRGSRPVTWAAAAAFAAALALPPLAPSLTTLALSLVVLGLTNGMLDVAMNAQAAAVQRRYREPVMGRIHALYSFGGLVGATVGGRVAAHGVGAAPHLAAVGLALGLGASAAALGMLPARADAVPEHRSSLVRPTRALALLGVVAFCVLFGEGAMANWSAVYLREVGGAGPGLAAAGFAAFSLTMAAGRAAGDALTTRLGAARLARAGGVVAALGVAAAMAVPRPWAAVLGFAAVGAGLSSVFPTVLAATARLPGVVPGAAIAVVSMCGYSGLLAGPPLIGAVAGALTLRGGLALAGITSLVIVALAGTLTGRSRSASEPQAHPAPVLAAS
ncbi:MAG TPA: MFS transporter [Gemmatimonadaceae bacterium]|nr:MFS transporter [Gemmatimonadaceae bacterium]